MFTGNIVSHLRDFAFKQQRVFLRVDFNVPLSDGVVKDDYKLIETLKTIDYLLQQDAIVILATHIGKPAAPKPELSTKHLVNWFINRGYSIVYVPHLNDVEKHCSSNTRLIMLENLRFFPEEQQSSISFAQKLAQLADYYVNDAFGALHRDDTSLRLTAQQFAENRRTIGFLVERELQELKKLFHAPKPYFLIIGGAKIADKIPVLMGLLSEVSDILLGPAICFTFLKALAKPVGKSLVDEHAIPACHALIAAAEQKNVTLHFPLDYLVAAQTINGMLSPVNADNIAPDQIGITIGQRTEAQYAQLISGAKTIFCNGLMGFLDKKETLKPMETLLQAMTRSEAFSVVAGGDCVAAVRTFGLINKISYCSTGGGATLHYIAGESLPGLTPFISSKISDKN